MIPTDWSYLNSVKSGPYADLIYKNREEQIKFIKNINYTKNVLIKEPPVLYDGYTEIYNKNGLSDKFVNSSLAKLVPTSKICVCSYIGTTFFELMSNDVPFITFVKFSENIFTKEFNYYLKKLKNYNFLFHSSVLAAKFLNENHNNFSKLWMDDEFYQFRKEFKHNWCKNQKNWQEIVMKDLS